MANTRADHGGLWYNHAEGFVSRAPGLDHRENRSSRGQNYCLLCSGNGSLYSCLPDSGGMGLRDDFHDVGRERAADLYGVLHGSTSTGSTRTL